MVLLGLGSGLAVASTGTLVLTDDPRVLRLAIAVALWAFVLGAMAGTRRRSPAEETSGPTKREIELHRAYQVELDREVAARREYELRIEVEIRRELESGLHQQLDVLRHEMTELRHDVVERLAGELRLERIAWHGESTRLTGGPAGLRGLGKGTSAIAGEVGTSAPGLPAPGVDPDGPTRREPRVEPRRPAPSRAATSRPPPSSQPPPVSMAAFPAPPPVRPDPLSDPLPPEALLPLAPPEHAWFGSETGEFSRPPMPATASPASDLLPVPRPGEPAGGGRHARPEVAGGRLGTARPGVPSHQAPDQDAPDRVLPSAAVPPTDVPRRHRRRADDEENEVLSRTLRER